MLPVHRRHAPGSPKYSDACLEFAVAVRDAERAGWSCETVLHNRLLCDLRVVGDGPDGAGIFDGFRRVYVMARSSQTLLDGK